MAFVKTICLFLLINCLLCCSPLGISIQHDKFSVMLRHVGKILSECTKYGMHNAGVVRHSKSNWNWPIEFVSNVCAVNLKDSDNAEEFEALTYQNTPRRNQTLQTFIILTNSSSNFQRLVRKLRKTVLWNPVAQYLILDESTDKTGCQNTLTFLNISWTEDLLHSTYFCLDPKDGFILYTYNPYIRKAPDPWKEIDAFQYTFKNRLRSIFKQKFIAGRTACRDFSFDKTRNMDGHPLNALVLQTGANMLINLSRPEFKQVYGPGGDIIMTALEKLGPRLNLTVMWKLTNAYDYQERMKNGEWDILLNSQFIFNKPGMKMTYPHEDSGINILTQLPENEKQYMRVLTYMNPILIGLVFLAFVVTSIVLFICTRKGVVLSSLEAYRLLLGASIIRSPRRNPLRIYVMSVTVLFMLTSSVFQSSLSSLLTVPVHKPYIDSEDDLRKNPDLLIYAYHQYHHVVGDDWINAQIRPINSIECVEQVKANPKAACAAGQMQLIMNAIEDNLHISRERMTTLHLGYIVRPNWPLYSRLSYILTVLSQTGIVRYLRNRNVRHTFEKWAQREKEQWSTHVYHVMTVKELLFAFYILLFGLGLAIIVFFLELCVAKRRLREYRRRTY